MKFIEGTKVCVSIQTLYNSFPQLTFGEIVPDFGDTDYYDLYNEDGELACLDGEEVIIEQVGEQLITFRNDNGESSIHFALTYKEAEMAIIK